jgi:putative heme-binding domain-containing protein
MRAAVVACLETSGLEEAGVELAEAGRVASLRSELEALARGQAGAASEPLRLRLRIGAIRALAALDASASVLVLAEIVREGSAAAVAGAAPALGEEAIAALGQMSGSAPQKALREILTSSELPSARSAVVKALGSSKSGALLLLQLTQAGELPEAARALATTVVHSSAYEDVRLLADKILPRPQEKGGKELPPARDILALKADSARGRKAFFNEEKGNCGRCHRIEKKGSDVGPDLTAIGVKYGREGLLESILSPSAAISHEYKVWILETRSAGFVTGYIVEESDGEVMIRDANGKVLKFKKADVLGRAASDVSLMPEGLVGSMTVNDLADIVEFLSRQKPKEATGGN